MTAGWRARRNCSQASDSSTDPGMVLWQQKPEVLLSGITTVRWEIQGFPAANLGFSSLTKVYVQLSTRLRQRLTTGNGKKVAKTGNTYISGTMTDWTKIPTASLGFFDRGELDKCVQELSIIRKWK